MSIDWVAFLTVFISALIGAVSVVVLYSLGIRFLATQAPPATAEDRAAASFGPARDDEDDDVDDVGRPLWATIAAYVCFGLSVVAVLVGVFLIVPALHFW